MPSSKTQHHVRIAVLSGDGIGPEVMRATLGVLQATAARYNLSFTFEEADVGGIAIERHGLALPLETIKVCESCDAILFGSVGGPQWERLPPAEQPERAALLPLRKHFGLFANLRPTTTYASLAHASTIRLERFQSEINFLVVRELTGGIYFAAPKKRDRDSALDTLCYTVTEIERIAHVAFQAASERRGGVTSIDKANVLTSMGLWRDVVTNVGRAYPGVELRHMYVDNAAMQLILDPTQFDVILCPNMFGDILSDEAAALAGSLGMQPSASLGTRRDAAQGYFGLYEPAGGSAPDIAGKNIANPVAQILSAALLLEYSVQHHAASTGIFRAVAQVIAAGHRTADIASRGERIVGTEEYGTLVAEALRRSPSYDAVD